MQVENTGVSRADNVLGLDDGEVGLELGDSLDGLGGRGEDETGLDLIVVDATETETDVVTAECGVELLGSLGVDGGNFDGVLVGHEEEGVALLDAARLDLAHGHGTELVVLLGNGKHEGSVDVAVHDLQAVEVLEERGSLGPGGDLLVDAVLHVLAHLRRHGDEGKVGLGVEADSPEERSDLGLNLVEAVIVSD